MMGGSEPVADLEKVVQDFSSHTPNEASKPSALNFTMNNSLFKLQLRNRLGGICDNILGDFL